MKLLHVIGGADRGGAKTHVLTLTEELRRTEELRLVCLGDGVLAREASARGLAPFILKGGFPAQSRALQWLLRTETPDILHCHGARANLLGALMNGNSVGRRIATVHSDHTLDYLSRPVAAGTLGALNGWALGRMDALVCVSEAMAERYRARGYEQVWPIYNGLDFGGAIPGRRADPRFVTVGTAARLDPVKDIPTLLRGFALAAEQEPGLRLRIAGAGPEERRLKALAAAEKCADRIEFCGWVEDMERFYAALDIVALTSVSETFPYALLTAAQQALPVVSTDVGGVAALVEDGVGGILFPVGDAAALCAALLRLSRTAEDRRAMGRALRKRAAEHFSLEQMTRTQRGIYQSVLRRGAEQR